MQAHKADKNQKNPNTLIIEEEKHDYINLKKIKYTQIK